MAEHATEHGHEHGGSDEHHHGRYHPHVVPLWLLVVVFAALLVLTFITVEVTRFEWGMWDLAVALLIAAVKSSLVVLYFMHLRWDSPFNSVVVVAAFLFLALFLWFAIIDTGQYAGSKQPTAEREGLAPMLTPAEPAEAAEDEGGAES